MGSSGPNESWSNVGRLGLTFGLGAWLGAPGYIAGGVLGSVLFPPEAPEAPDPYTAMNLNTAEEGAPVALHYGVNKAKGNWIYKGEIRSRKVEEGGKGGQKTVTGYKYWTWAALGLGKGIVDVTRTWKNDDIYLADGNATMVLYRGTADQIRDPDWDVRAEDVVPLKRTAYWYLNNFYLGEDNNTMPTISSEIHRHPWDTVMGDLPPYVLNKVSEQTIGGAKVMRDKYDDILVFDQTSMRVYNSDWELQRTLDMTPIGLPSFQGSWDVVLTYSKSGRTDINLIWGNDGTDVLELYRFGKTTKNLNNEKTTLVRGTYRKYNVYVPAGSSSFTAITADSNSQFIFIGEYNQIGAISRLHKVSLAGSTTLATYDLTAGSVGSPNSVAVNEDFVFWQKAGGGTYMISFTGTILDSVGGVGGGLLDTPNAICALYGAPCIVGVAIGVNSTPDYDSISFVTYDRDTQQFITNSQTTLNTAIFWDAGESPLWGTNSWEGNLQEGANGTLYYTGHDPSNNYYSMEMIVDANPGHIMYDLFKQAKGFDLTTVDTDELETVGTTCFDNRIGMSFSLVRKQNVGAVIRDILGHLQAHPYQTDEGKFGFFMPNPNDAVVDTITKDDVLAITNQGQAELSIISSSLKDIGLCPNRLNVTYENRLNQYKRDATFQLDDMLAQDLDGQIIEEKLNYQMFSNPAVISKMAWKAWKIGRFQNMLHTTVLNGRWLKIRHGEVYNLDFPDDELPMKRCRVFSIQDAPASTEAGITVTWMMDDEFLTSYEEIDYDASISGDTSVGPPEEVVPVVWEEDARYNNDIYTLGLSAIRTGNGTAYCDVFISLDAPDNFFYAKRLTQFANVGDLVTDVTTLDRNIKVNTDAYTESTFATYSRTNQRNNISYCLIGEASTSFDLALTNMEFFTYRQAVVSGSDLELRKVVRGKDYTRTKPHLVSDDTVVLNTGISYNKVEIPSEWIGKTLYFKFIPYNLRGDGLEEDDVDTYEYTLQGWTRKATHTDRLQIEDSVRGELGTRTKTNDSDVKVIWEYTNRNSGMGEAALDTWEWQGWMAGDVDDYDVIIYQSDGVTVQAEHLGIGLIDEYTYTNIQNTTDFGTPSDHFWIGIRPVVTGRGVGREGYEIMKQEVERI